MTPSPLPPPPSARRSRRRLAGFAAAAALLLLAAACGDDDDDGGGTEETTAPTTTAAVGGGEETTAAPATTVAPGSTEVPASSGESTFAITRIELGADGFAEITNVSSEPADPDGWFVCQFPNYIPVAPGELAPGESVQVVASALGGLDPVSGELGLYSRGGNFGDVEAIVDYVEWGEPGHERAPVAEAAGIWSVADTVDTGGATAIVADDDAGFVAE